VLFLPQKKANVLQRIFDEEEKELRVLPNKRERDQLRLILPDLTAIGTGLSHASLAS
jgi:hypothetical protein